MRIACVDESAQDRIALQELLDRAFQACRDTIGHLWQLAIVPAVPDEVLVNQPPECVVLGPQLSIDEKLSLCRRFKDSHPALPVVVFLAPEQYSLRVLRRFERVAAEIFVPDEQPVRIVHRLSSFCDNRSRLPGALITVEGVKGGVGATSICSGLAHAAHALHKRSVLVDLSGQSALCHYLAAPRWQSSEHTALLLDEAAPEPARVERCITVAPCGVSILLPPAGGSEVREAWLRSPVKFELSLGVIEVLQEMFDVVIVDLAGAEGVLPYALESRAQSRVLVSSNDPAAVYLLGGALSRHEELPRAGTSLIVYNELLDGGLAFDDMLDFLWAVPRAAGFESAMRRLRREERALHWQGTGNSFYTESGSAVRRLLDLALEELLGVCRQLPAVKRGTLLDQLRAGIRMLAAQPLPERRLLPHLPDNAHRSAGASLGRRDVARSDLPAPAEIVGAIYQPPQPAFNE